MNQHICDEKVGSNTVTSVPPRPGPQSQQRSDLAMLAAQGIPCATGRSR